MIFLIFFIVVDCQNGRNKEKARPRKRWTDKVEENLKIMGIRNRYTVPSDWQEWSRTVMEAKGSYKQVQWVNMKRLTVLRRKLAFITLKSSVRAAQ